MTLEAPLDAQYHLKTFLAKLLHAKPRSSMSPFLGKQYTLRGLGETHDGLDEIENLWFVRAFQVLPLTGAVIQVKNEKEIAGALRALFIEKLPGIDWEIKDDWSGPFLKYLILHGSVPAPMDKLTSESMALEIFGSVFEIDGINMKSAEGRAWQDQRRNERIEQLGKHNCDPENMDFNELYPSISGDIKIEISQSTYANVMFTGIGVPFYS